MTTRDDVIKAARRYCGTPFLHQARVCGLGVDCVGLILCVGDDLQLVNKNGRAFGRQDYPNYPREPVNSFVQTECRARLLKPIKNLQAGDVVTMRIPLRPCHAGFIADRGGVLYLIHAYNGGTHKVVEHILDAAWRRRITAAFSIPGVVDQWHGLLYW